MASKRVATLTLNPAIDLGFEVDRVFPTHKIRADHERYFPGGGGINVARVLARLGCDVHCLYLSGGATGLAFDALVAELGLDHEAIPIAGRTRVAPTVVERDSGKEFRFTPAGPEVTESEWRACLERIESTPCDYLVASGSLPRGVPDDFYARIAAMAARRGIGFVLDTSGTPLRRALDHGGILLAKPSLGEFQQLQGREFDGPDAIGEAAMDLVRQGAASAIAVTMGHRGAVLASQTGVSILPALPIEARSAVGAGDSLVAGMVHGLAQGRTMEEAFVIGVAAGTAAVLSHGCDLAHPQDIDRLLTEMPPLVTNMSHATAISHRRP